MGGRRTDAISERDLEVLEFIARFGIVPRQAVAIWAGTRRTATLDRERRLRISKLIIRTSGIGTTGPLLLPTRAGLAACGRPELRGVHFSFARASHEATVATLAARLERAGDRLFSEREIMARERLDGDRHLSASLPNGRHHRPDLIRISATLEAVEVELTPKAPARLDELLRAWRRAVVQSHIARVVYCCSGRTLRHVERAVKRTHTHTQVGIEQLQRPAKVTPGQHQLAALDGVTDP
jgi:hypothetical protein